MKNFISFLLLAFTFSFNFYSQTTTINFETAGDGYTPSTTFGSNFTDVFNRTNYDISGVSNEDGYYWAVEDISDDPSITLDQINVSGSSTFNFSIDMLAHHFDDWDSTDEVLITYSLDGGSYQNLMWVQMVPQGSGSATNEPAALDTDFDGGGNCGANTTLPSITTGTGSQGCQVSSSDFATFTASNINLNSATTLDIKLQFNGLTSGDEGIYLDNIIIQQDASADPEPTNQPTNFSVSAVHEKINLTWTDAATGSQAPAKYLIIGETDPSIDNPVDGTSISNDSDSSDGRIAVNVNHGTQTTSFSNVGNNIWYFEIFPYTNSGSDIDFKTDGTIATSNVTTNAIQITEIVYNDVSSGNDFEWIELYNPTGSPIDITGYHLTDSAPYYNQLSGNSGNGFPSSTIIPANSYFTVLVDGDGSTPTGFSADYDPTTYCQYCSLGDNGDSVILTDASDNIVDQVDYDDGSPWPTSPDGSFYSLEIKPGSNNYYGASWQASIPEYGSPGKKSSEAWDTNLTSSDNLTISSPDNVYITSNETINNLTVSSGSFLTIEKGNSLIISGNLTSSGGSTIQSDSNEFGSLIVQGTSSGNVTYNRWINSISSSSPTSSDPGWDLVGSPVIGASLTSSNFSQNGSNYAIQPYDNSDNTWTATSSASVSTSLGTGYAMAKATAGVEAFTGTIETDDKDVDITNNDGSGSGTQWNLVANPYPSYLALNSNARSASSATTDFITQNAETADVLGSGTNEDALWYWTGSEYGQYNNSSSAKYIAPGQGFFVASKTGGGTLKFLESMQTTTGGDDFIAGDIMDDNRGELFVNLNQNDLSRNTEIYFIENTTDSSDPTYDARTFPMNDNATSIYTRLVEGDEGVDLGIQALAYSEMWDKVIPLGINALGGEEMTISISHRTTPADLNIYLEDTEEGTMTNLLDGDFVYTPAADLEGVGRFFIHMTADTMSNGEVSTSLLNAYKEIDASYITIEGLATQSNETKVSLYNILGREVFSTTLNNNMGTQTISTVGLSTGIYVIVLESGSDRLTKKLLIQ